MRLPGLLADRAERAWPRCGCAAGCSGDLWVHTAGMHVKSRACWEGVAVKADALAPHAQVLCVLANHGSPRSTVLGDEQ
jgi:hypothetical protein